MHAVRKLFTLLILTIASQLAVAAPHTVKSDTAVQHLLNDLHSATAMQVKAAKYLDLAQYYVDKPGEDKNDLNTAVNYNKSGIELSRNKHLSPEIVRALGIYSQIYREKGDAKTGMLYADSALLRLKSVNDPMVSANVYFEKSKYYSIARDSNLTLKTRYFREGTGFLRQAAPNSLKLADALKFLGDLEINSSGGKPALALLREALSIYQSKGYQQLQDIYDMIAYALSTLERPREGLQYEMMAIRSGEHYKDSSMTMCAIYNHLSYIYNNINEDAKCAQSMEKALMYARRNHETTTAYILTGNLAMAYTDIHQYVKALRLAETTLTTVPAYEIKIRALLMIDMVRIYTVMHQNTKAQQLYKELNILIKGTNQPDIIWDNDYAAGINLYMNLHDYAQVNNLITQYRNLIVEHKLVNLLSKLKLASFTYKADSAQGNFEAAFRHLAAYKQLNDSVTNRNHDKELSEMQLQYETRKKDEDIAAKAKNIDLLTSKTKLQQTALQSNRLIRNLSIIAVAMLLVLSALIYNRYQLKQRANRRLESQQHEIHAQNIELKQLVTEREWLIKEVHHRVKNNLQIVISLLNSQASFLENGSARDVIRESRNRMSSISLIHQKLYQTSHLSSVDMHVYVADLISQIRDSFSISNLIKFKISVEKMMLDVSQAVPLGLIINEAVTNSVKYAFEPGQEGDITISLITEGELARLTISDTGKGLAEEFDIVNAESLGMNLMDGLARQLGGRLRLQNKQGLTILLTFKIRQAFGIETEKPPKPTNSLPAL